MAYFPPLARARVIAVDPVKRQLTVTLPSTQVLTVRMGEHGPADGIRVKYSALPTRGTEGLIALPSHDPRGAIWICSLYGQMENAYTGNDPHTEYNSHWSGFYELLDQTGNHTQSYPDGTFLKVGQDTTKAATTRTIVNPDQTVSQVPFTDAERVASLPGPFHVFLGHASGTQAHIDPSGNTTLTGAENAALTAVFGATTVKVDGSGNMTVSGANGASFNVTYNGATIQIDQSGGIGLNAAAGRDLTFQAGGGTASYTLVRTDLLLNWLNSHTHTGVQAGGSDTGPPASPATAAGIQSTIAGVSQ